MMMQNTQGQMNIISLKKGTVIFWQGDTDKALYKILTGVIGIYAAYETDKVVSLAKLERDHCFGEMSILEGLPRSATAVVEEDASLAVYPEHMMGSFIRQNPSFALDIMNNLSQRLRASSTELERMHRMLVEVTQSKVPKNEVLSYVRLHTFYDKDGAPHFKLNA